MNAFYGVPERILVQMDECHWTQNALHAAARMAHGGGEVILVDMIPVGFPGWLGMDMGNTFRKRRPELGNWKATLEDYGAAYRVEAFQYISLVEGLAQAAEYFDARVVFAQIPHSIIPYEQRFQRWCLRQRLNQIQCQLCDADMPLPALVVKETPASILR